MMKVLAAWLGMADIRASNNPDKETEGIGPIAQALTDLECDLLFLLTDMADKEVESYIEWLGKLSDIRVARQHVGLTDPTEYREIYLGTTSAIDALLDAHDGKEHIELFFHTSPGTPQMQTVWVLLANTRYEATLIQTNPKQKGVKIPDIPFEIAAQFIPKVLEPADRKLHQAAAEIPSEGAHFGDIIYRSKEMARVIDLAKKAAPRNIPVLIQGDSGTGKELLARAIHAESPRSNQPFIAINCGAIPRELIESELFGHKKGAFTGANMDRKGVFEEAHEGTLFLDELGELPLEAQVKLLRVVQEGTVTRIGTSDERKVNVRLIAATNRNLSEEVAKGRFREDLFYRLAIAIIEIPSLKEREGDIGLLLDRLLDQVSSELSEDPNASKKILSVSARNIAINHSWPGNVRELLNTLRRVVLWSDEKEISAQEMHRALLPRYQSQNDKHEILNKDLSQPIDLDGIISDVARHYLARAMKETGGNKAKAARILGLNSATTLSNRLKKYHLE
jgi:transcriptional regulator with PAS, ATPase and Fis domain